MNAYLPNLKKGIKTGKTGTAKKLLAKIHQRPADEKQEILQCIALASDKTAFELLDFLTAKENTDPEIHDRLIQLVTDRAHLNYDFVRILFKNADRSVIIHAAPLLKHVLSTETDRELLSAVIRTSGTLKIESMTADLAEFIFYDDLHLKSNAVSALERIGTPDALDKLEQAAKTEKCDQDILDAIQALKSEQEPCLDPEAPACSAPDETEEINLEDLSAGSAVKRFKALTVLSEKEIDLAEILGRESVQQDHDLMVNLLRITARTIPLDAVNILFDLIRNKETDNHIKFLAYNALESFPDLESAASVVKGLSEPAMFVRLAAVKVLDKNLSDYVCAEIKNSIESGTKKGELLAQTILDARARNIIKYLMISDTFSYIASNYLSKTAPIPVLDTFIDILQSKNLRSTARKYLDMREKRNSGEQDPFVVISSSDAILNIYSKLIFSCGFPCLSFIRTQDAFEAIVFQKPRAVICDLFFNELTGMDLAREIRDMYPKEEVPVIISTLQKHLDPEIFKKELASAGVNTHCEFPAKTSQLKSWAK